MVLGLLMVSAVLCGGDISWKAYFYNEANTRSFAVYQPDKGEITLPSGEKVKGGPCAFDGGVLDLDALAPGGTNRAVLEGVFKSENARSAWIGMGCKVFAVTFNGENVYNFLQKGLGNDYDPVTADDHVFKVNVRKGENRIVIQTYRTNWLLDFCYGVKQRAPWRLCFSEKKDYTPSRAALAHPPVFTRPEKGGIMVTFITETPIPAGMDYRPVGSDSWKRVWDLKGGIVLRESSRIHRIQLEDLIPGRDYEYRLVLLEPPGGMDGFKRSLWSKRKYREVLLPTGRLHCGAADEFSFFLFGDTQLSLSEGCKTVAQRKVLLDSMRATEHYRKADFLVHIGDLTSYSHFIEQSMFTEFFDDFSPAPGGADRSWVYVRGNHEINGLGSEEWFDYFAPEGGDGYYSFTRGGAMFIVLDCGDFPNDPVCGESGPLIFRQELMRRQEKWLMALRNTPEYRNARFRIILCHTEPMLATDGVSRDVAKLVKPLLEDRTPEGMIHLWLAGHTHYYWRVNRDSDKLLAENVVRKKPDNPVSPVTFVTTDGPKSSSRKPDFSYLYVQVGKEAVTVQAYDEKGSFRDAFSVDRTGRVFDEKISEELKIHSLKK